MSHYNHCYYFTNFIIRMLILLALWCGKYLFIHTHLAFGIRNSHTVYCVCSQKMKIHAGLHNQMANNIHMYMNQNWIGNVIAVVLAATVAGLKVKIYYVSFSFYLNKC